MKIRFIQSWRQYKVGQVFPDWHEGAAKLLIRQGIAAKVEEQPETAMLGSDEVETATLDTPKHKKRGKACTTTTTT